MEYIPEPRLSKVFFADQRVGWIWLILRFYVGYEWFMAGWAKVQSPAWVGDQAGTAIQGFLNGALSKASEAHPDVSGWYAWFVSSVAIPHAVLFSYLVAYGELAVGIGLVLGAFTGIAAFSGAFYEPQLPFRWHDKYKSLSVLD